MTDIILKDTKGKPLSTKALFKMARDILHKIPKMPKYITDETVYAKAVEVALRNVFVCAWQIAHKRTVTDQHLFQASELASTVNLRSEEEGNKRQALKLITAIAHRYHQQHGNKGPR